MPIDHYDYILIENSTPGVYRHYHILNGHIYRLISKSLVPIVDKHNHFEGHKQLSIVVSFLMIDRLTIK